jgi:hypothetical protein
MRNMILTLRMAKELARGFSIKSNIYVRFLRLIVLTEATENNSPRLTRFCTKKDRFAI